MKLAAVALLACASAVVASAGGVPPLRGAGHAAVGKGAAASAKGAGGSKGNSNGKKPVRDSGNPFVGQKFYVNPANSREYDASIATATGTTKTTLQQMKGVPSVRCCSVAFRISQLAPPSQDHPIPPRPARPTRMRACVRAFMPSGVLDRR